MALRLEVVVSYVKVVKSSVLLMRRFYCGDGVVDVVIADVEMWSVVKFDDLVHLYKDSMKLHHFIVTWQYIVVLIIIF